MSEWIAPNEGWNDNSAPVGSDLRRIEGNTNALHTMILTEASERLAADNSEVTARNEAINNAVQVEANARQAADQVEANARANADNSVLSGHPSFYIENRTNDPANPHIGHMWIRLDL